jgi:hypothetical protein
MSFAKLTADKLGGDYQKTKDVNLLRGFANTQKPLIGHRGNTFANVMTGEELESEIIHRVKAFGKQRGALLFYDEDGVTPLRNATFYSNELGKMVTTDSEGKFMYGNKAIVDQSVKFYEEREALIDKYVEQCKVNNEICAYMLGYGSVAELRTVLGTKGKFKVEGDELVDEDLINADGMPESIRRTAPGKDKQLSAIYKLRLLVGERLAYINLMDFGRKKSDKDDPNVFSPDNLGVPARVAPSGATSGGSGSSRIE